MPKDASDTRERLLIAALHAFATHGIDGASIKAIVSDAGQRNDSALHYHFGSRAGLLSTIVSRYHGLIDERRGLGLAALEAEVQLDNPSSLVAVMVDPLVDLLGQPDGRAYLRLVAQLTTRMQIAPHLTPEVHVRLDGLGATGTGIALPNLARIFNLLAGVIPTSRDDVITHRLSTASTFVGVILGERARRIDEHSELMLDERQFRDDLVAMTVGLISVAAPRRARGQR